MLSFPVLHGAWLAVWLSQLVDVEEMEKIYLVLFCLVNARFNFSVMCDEQASHPCWHNLLEF